MNLGRKTVVKLPMRFLKREKVCRLIGSNYHGNIYQMVKRQVYPLYALPNALNVRFVFKKVKLVNFLTYENKLFDV